MSSQSAALLEEPKLLSVSLNSYHRADVLRAMLTHRFKAEIESQFPLWADLAKRTYDSVYDASTQKKMKALPEGWLPESGHLKVSFGPTVVQLQFNGGMADCQRRLVSGVVDPDTLERRVAAKHAGRNSHNTPIAAVFDATDELSTVYSKLEADHKSLLERIKQTSAKVEGALASFNTTKQVIQAWPEAAPFLPGAIAPRTAVAIPRADLNKLLSLDAVAVSA